MNRVIHDPSELDALPVGSVVLGADHPDAPRRLLGERISPRWNPDAKWNVDGRHCATETVLAVLGGAATVLHDPSAPVPAPSATREEVAGAVTFTTIDVNHEVVAAYFEGVTDEMVLRVRRNITPKEDR